MNEMDPPEGLDWTESITETGDVEIAIKTSSRFSVGLLVASTIVMIVAGGLAVFFLWIEGQSTMPGVRYHREPSPVSYIGMVSAVVTFGAFGFVLRSIAAIFDRPTILVGRSGFSMSGLRWLLSRPIHEKLRDIGALEVKPHNNLDWLPFSDSWKIVAPTRSGRRLVLQLRLQTYEQATWAIARLNRLIREARDD